MGGRGYSHKYSRLAHHSLGELKGANGAVVIRLMEVAATELRADPDPNDPDEGLGREGLRWRAGITRSERTRREQHRTRLSGRGLATEDYRGDGRQAEDYALVYAVVRPPPRPHFEIRDIALRTDIAGHDGFDVLR